MGINGVDLSSNNETGGAPNFDVIPQDIRFAFTKVTQGTDYYFPGSQRNRSETARTGRVCGVYHFSDYSNPVAEAEWFINHVGQLAPGEIPILDYDTNVGDPPTWCAGWMGTVRDAWGVVPMLYVNGDTIWIHDFTPLRDSGLWYPDPTGEDHVADGLPVWGSAAVTQWTWSGSVPGINGEVDINTFDGTEDQLRKYGLQGGAPAPAPLPGPDSLPSLEYGQTSPAVASLQRFLNAFNWQPPLPLLPVTGYYGDMTTAILNSAQSQMGVLGGDGRNVGPQTKRALWARGWRGQ